MVIYIVCWWRLIVSRTKTLLQITLIMSNHFLKMCFGTKQLDKNYVVAKAKQLELGVPSNVDYLHSIYNNPSNYIVYVLADVEGNCEVSSHAEQNHSFITNLRLYHHNTREKCGGALYLPWKVNDSMVGTSFQMVSDFIHTMPSNQLQSRMERAAWKVLDKRPFHTLLLRN